MMADPDKAKAGRAAEEMMNQVKFDIAETARRPTTAAEGPHRPAKAADSGPGFFDVTTPRGQ